MMISRSIRKTHPMVLTAAAALTLFSIIGSAAITGLIPSAHSNNSEFQPVTTGNASHLLSENGQNEAFNSTVHGKSDAPSVAPGNSDAKAKPSLSGKDSKKPGVCSICGVIESIHTVEQDGDASGLGAVAGGVVGGVVGNQMGKGKGNTLMTIIGLGSGAYAGHTIEKNMKSTTAYVIKVRMQDGTYRSVTQPSQPEYAVGDHVRVTHGSLTSA